MDIRTVIIIGLSILLLLAIAVSGFFYWQLESQPDPFPVPVLPTPQPVQNTSDINERIDIYYLNSDYTQFIIETRSIIKSRTIPDRIHRALDELLNRNKTPEKRIAPIPEGTTLQSVFWGETDGRVYLSFSKEIIENAPGNSLAEWATIYSIVNTVAAQSSTVKEVQFLIDGERIQSPNTDWDWSLPFQKDMTLVRY